MNSDEDILHIPNNFMDADLLNKEKENLSLRKLLQISKKESSKQLNYDSSQEICIKDEILKVRSTKKIVNISCFNLWESPKP